MALPLTVRDLSVYAGARHLLHVAKLNVAAGQAIGIKGPSGAGKSTLLFALAGLVRTATGHIGWGETDLLALNEGARTAFRANTIGMVFQDFLLFDALTARENAALTAGFSCKAHRAGLHRRAKDHLDHLGLKDADRMASTYSGGERQRIGVARALAKDAPVLLADEPTASLDRSAADALIADLLTTVRANGTTFITVSHDPGLLAHMDQVHKMTDGVLA